MVNPDPYNPQYLDPNPQIQSQFETKYLRDHLEHGLAGEGGGLVGLWELRI